ncbi:MAG: 3'-5' exonuclease [Bacteroidales bacterium]|nr:3'-5' exonuclease [Bacteroidales bacterium]
MDFLAIDFETATGQRSSICEIGICVVRNDEVVETRSWLVQPPFNRYSYGNVRVHGIRPEHTLNAPDFPQVWEEIERLYLDEFNNIVAHNMPFDRSCLRKAAEYYNVHLPEIKWHCSLQLARKLYGFCSYSLGHLCASLGIPEGTHHRAGDDAEMCARLFLREISDLLSV